MLVQDPPSLSGSPGSRSRPLERRAAACKHWLRERGGSGNWKGKKREREKMYYLREKESERGVATGKDRKKERKLFIS